MGRKHHAVTKEYPDIAVSSCLHFDRDRGADLGNGWALGTVVQDFISWRSDQGFEAYLNSRKHFWGGKSLPCLFSWTDCSTVLCVPLAWFLNL